MFVLDEPDEILFKGFIRDIEIFLVIYQKIDKLYFFRTNSQEFSNLKKNYKKILNFYK